jgi:hypothetical protein
MSSHDAHATGQSADSTHDHGDTTGGHGMLLFGDDPLYLSHLPMFHHPHDFQVLVAVRLDDRSSQALLAHRATGGPGIYTFLPEDFPIAELDPRRGQVRTAMPGTVFREHFERGGTPIADGAVAEVVRVVHFEQLADRAPAADAPLRYLAFGSADRLQLAHAITARPSFDQVLTSRVRPGSLTDMAGRSLADDLTALTWDRGQLVEVDREDVPERRLAPGSTVRGTFRSTTSPSGMHGFSAEIEVQEEVYLEIAELR